jgi:retinol dehydrogenase 12
VIIRARENEKAMAQRGIKLHCEEDLQGKIAIVTGANTGIGFETAKKFMEKGAHCIFACRSIERGMEAVERIKSERGRESERGTSEVMGLDLSNTESIVKFAKEFTKKHSRLDILVNNAGLNMSANYKGAHETKQGYEMCMGTNYFGHFMLTSLLLPSLQKGKGTSRVVALSSVTTWFASNKYHFFVKGKSKTKGNYSTSKLACLAMTRELQRRLDEQNPDNNVECVAADPGFVASDIWRDYNVIWRKIAQMLALTPEEGAMTPVHAATLKTVKKGQLYMPFSIKLSKVFKFNKGLGYKCMALQRVFAGFTMDDCAPKAKDLKANEDLWRLSVDFCKDNGAASAVATLNAL